MGEARADCGVVARIDQAVENAKQAARPVVAFHNKLAEGGIDPEAARQLTILYARVLFGPKSKGGGD